MRLRRVRCHSHHNWWMARGQGVKGLIEEQKHDRGSVEREDGRASLRGAGTVTGSEAVTVILQLIKSLVSLWKEWRHSLKLLHISQLFSLVWAAHDIMEVQLCVAKGWENRSLDCWQRCHWVCVLDDSVTECVLRWWRRGLSRAAESTLGSERWAELGFPPSPSWCRSLLSESRHNTVEMLCILVSQMFIS